MREYKDRKINCETFFIRYDVTQLILFTYIILYINIHTIFVVRLHYVQSVKEPYGVSHDWETIVTLHIHDSGGHQSFLLTHHRNLRAAKNGRESKCND